MKVAVPIHVSHHSSINSSREDYANYSVSTTSVKYKPFLVQIAPVQDEADGRFGSSIRCPFCDESVCINIHQQEMLFYGKSGLAKNKGFAKHLVATINGRTAWIRMILLLIFCLAPVALGLIFYGYWNSGPWEHWATDRTLMFICLGLMVAAPLLLATVWPWIKRHHLTRVQTASILGGSGGLLIGSRYARKLNLPEPDWVESHKIIREILISSVSHKFRAGPDPDDPGWLPIVRPDQSVEGAVAELAKDKFKDW